MRGRYGEVEEERGGLGSDKGLLDAWQLICSCGLRRCWLLTVPVGSHGELVKRVVQLWVSCLPFT